MNKKISFLTMVTLIIFLVGLIGCGNEANSTKTSPTQSLTPTPTATTSPIPMWDFWINFNGNGGVHKSGYEYTAHLNPGNPFPYEIPKPEEIEYSYEGYTFKHWNTEADGTGKAYELGQILTGSGDTPTHLYAIWEKDS